MLDPPFRSKFTRITIVSLPAASLSRPDDDWGFWGLAVQDIFLWTFREYLHPASICAFRAEIRRGLPGGDRLIRVGDSGVVHCLCEDLVAAEVCAVGDDDPVELALLDVV